MSFTHKVWSLSLRNCNTVLWQGWSSPHATEVGFLWGPLRHRTRVDGSSRCLFEIKADGIRRADGTNCHDCGSSSSVCVCVCWWLVYPGCHDCSHAPQMCSPTQPESNQSDSGQVRLETSHQQHTLHTHPPHVYCPKTILRRHEWYLHV